MKSNRMMGCAANAWFVRCLFLLISLTLLMALMPSAHAAELPEVCYPTSVQCSEDKTELKKIYDLTPEADPRGIARSDFERDGYHYTLVELLRQELPQEESREHTETVSLQSAKKDMESVLAIFPQEKEFITDDGLIGTLTLRLDTVQIEPSGYGSTTKEISAKRSYPNLAEQDTQYLPKSIEENGKTLALTDIRWQTDNTANMDGYAVADRYTAIATYTGSTTSSYIKGYDAWSYDNHDDPILSLVYATLQNGQGLDLSSNSGIRILNAATAVFDAVTGKNLTALMNGLKGLRIPLSASPPSMVRE